MDDVKYKVKKIRCGKPNCKACPHDGYVYVQVSCGGKPKTFYVGKLDKIIRASIDLLAQKLIQYMNENTKKHVWGIPKFRDVCCYDFDGLFDMNPKPFNDVLVYEYYYQLGIKLE